MATAPETRHARSGDVNIAYQVIGEGPRDLVRSWSPTWRAPGSASLYRGLHALEGVPGQWHIFAADHHDTIARTP